MAETGRLVGGAGQHNHSTLEVVPTQDYDKFAFNKNDKVAFVPCHEHDKIVVLPQPYDAVHDYQANSGSWSPQTTLAQSASAWDFGTGASGRDVGTGNGERICGLKRRVFFVVLVVLALLVAVGVGVGAGVGISMRSRSNAEADATASSTSETTAIFFPPMPTPSTVTPASRTSSAPQSTATRRVGGTGGRCSNNWGSDCMCLDESICAGKWNGTVQTGRRPDWPCPDDPTNIKGCYVQPCRGASQPSSRCVWREGCAELDPGNSTAPVCPGGKDFICCAKLLPE